MQDGRRNFQKSEWSFEIDWTPESRFVGLRSLHRNLDPRNRLGAAVPVADNSGRRCS